MREDAYIRLVSLGGACQRLPLWVNIRRNVFDMINNSLTMVVYVNSGTAI